jgi:hypothetical protein
MNSACAELNARTTSLGRPLSAVVHASKVHSRLVLAAQGGLHGATYETGYTTVLPYDADDSVLGQAILDVLLRHAAVDDPTPTSRVTEWPAFRASGLRSVRSFESSFYRISVATTLHFGLDVRGSSLGEAPVVISRRLNLACGPEELGAAAFHIALACHTLDDAGLLR